MTRYAGRDISQKETTIYIVDERGRRLWRGTALTDPELVSRYGSDLRRSGLEVICLDARRAKAARASAGPTGGSPP